MQRSPTKALSLMLMLAILLPMGACGRRKVLELKPPSLQVPEVEQMWSEWFKSIDYKDFLKENCFSLAAVCIVTGCGFYFRQRLDVTDKKQMMLNKALK
jgi:predicted small lipoprotein YifL